MEEQAWSEQVACICGITVVVCELNIKVVEEDKADDSTDYYFSSCCPSCKRENIITVPPHIAIKLMENVED